MAEQHHLSAPSPVPGRSRSSRRARIRARAKRGLALLPSLLTLGNLVCGFFAIVRVASVQWTGGEPIPPDAFRDAALAILLAMVFDMLDGRVARLTRTTSDFGGQLDSLADAVTFGVAPGVLVAMIHAQARYEYALPFWSKMAWVFGAAYACGACIRLARFNVENRHDEEAHLSFKGLPSPAAAGVIATLVLLHHFLLSPAAGERLSWIQPTLLARAGHEMLNVLPFVTLAIGYLMVSRFPYTHVANRYFRGRKPFEYLTAAIFGAALFALFPEISAAALFCGFAVTGPAAAFRAWMSGAPAAAAGPAKPAGAPPSSQPATGERALGEAKAG